LIMQKLHTKCRYCLRILYLKCTKQSGNNFWSSHYAWNNQLISFNGNMHILRWFEVLPVCYRDGANIRINTSKAIFRNPVQAKSW
jgi:hypothetical protein